jgi:hypothetical protein
VAHFRKLYSTPYFDHTAHFFCDEHMHALFARKLFALSSSAHLVKKCWFYHLSGKLAQLVTILFPPK